MNRKLILASVSPRRKQLLRQLGLDFEVIPPCGVQEISQAASVSSLVKENALLKARQVASSQTTGVVLAADTVIEFGSQIIGKPQQKESAARILTMLSGQTHKVITAIALVDVDNRHWITDLETTEVTFKELSFSIIDQYLATEEYRDKAGAYAIQGLGAVLVKQIKGDYFNVVGLPLGLLADLLIQFGISVLNEPKVHSN